MHIYESWGLALLGGALLGASASLLLLFQGRTAGVAGLFSGLFLPGFDARPKRLLFLVGLIVGAIGFGALGLRGQVGTHPPLPLLMLGGLLVGYGAKLANGCTSGHGICGVSRGSPRSLVATITFIATGALTVLVMHTLGGIK